MATQRQLLIVEDEITTWLALKMQAEAVGRELAVTRFRSGGDQFNAWIATQPQVSVAIVDLQLPSKTGVNPDGGFEVVESITSTRPETRIIILSSRNDSQAFQRAQSLPGVRHYFTKPWNKETLRAAIKECLEPTDGTPKELVLHGDLERAN
jgi:CheY-like chemotaxis protein